MPIATEQPAAPSVVPATIRTTAVARSAATTVA
jgi:hypothetical protein